MGEVGGHNALEPAALGKPVLMGPNMDNARDIASKLLQCGGALQVANQEEFRQAAEKILTDDGLRDKMGRAGQELVDNNKGALDLTMKEIGKLL
jgi:3-deoxy-D-manno-octulosonic-acid transferase